MSTLVTKSQDDVLVASFQDVRIIDQSRISALGTEMTNLVSGNEIKKVLLNFDNVEFMSSAMIGKLVLFSKKCKANQVELRLCNINENVDEVFKLMRLNKVFKIDKDEELAIKNFSKKGWFG